MNRLTRWMLAVGLGCGIGQASAATAWSAQDYDLYPGDFNGDGFTDLLYISKDARHANGIVLSDGSGLNTPLQSWGNAYLGIPWSDGMYNIIVADFDGDGKADILLQRKTKGDHYLLLTEDGGVGAITQTIPNDAAGLTWSADQHQIVAGDFNGDGRADLFLQSTDPKGLNAVMAADASGMFTAEQPTQSWADGYLGFDWATSEAHVYAADFNGDRLADLLIQAQPVQTSSDVLVHPAQFPPNMNGVVLARADPRPFALEGVQAWSRDGFKADWSPLSSAVVTGDFNGDGRSDVILQGVTASNPSYFLSGSTPGAIFTTAELLSSEVTPTADSYRILTGNFTGSKQTGLYFQAISYDQDNYLGAVSGGAISVTAVDLPGATTDFSALPGTPASLSPASGGAGTMALLTVNTPGRTPGQFAVSPMGAATYQIPIWTPPGARGLEPHLALVYTSGSPDGMMGPGWNLAGLSAITRCNKTYADNAGAPAPVTLTTGATGDDFCIDGNRMRVTSGTYGASGSIYQTEIANFSRITAYGTAGNGPSYFYVEGKDGLIYEYGNTTDSKAYANGGSTPYAWMLNKVRDRQTQANNLKIVYSTASGAVQPSSIQYTQTPSTNGSTYPYTVAFTYQNRVTNLSKYVAGGSVQETKVLTKINVQSSGTSVRQYNLTYETAPTTQRDRLASIQECAGSAGTDCLKATTVSYQNGTGGIASPTISSGSGATYAGTLKTADINGDGLDDLLFATQSGSNYLWWVQFATASGFGAPVNTGASTTSTSNVLLDDFLGEGRNSILAANGSTWYQYRWNGTAFSATSAGIPVLTSTWAVLYASADVDGDGRSDVVYADLSQGISGSDVRPPAMVHLSTSSGSSASFAAAFAAGTFYFSLFDTAIQFSGNNRFGNSSVRHMDFDGDGRDDLAIVRTTVNVFGGVTTTTITSYLARGTAAFVAGPQLLSATPTTRFAPVRWNDDGCTDLQVGAAIQTSQCNGSYSALLTLPNEPDLLTDWDGDGRADALANVGGSWTMYRSLGTGVATGVSTGITASSGQWITLDRNGDGESDLAFSDAAASNAIKTGLHNGADAPPDLATAITDGWGVSVTTIIYVPITLSTVYTKGTTASFPEMDFQGAAYVVSQATQSDGIGGSFNNTFQYTGARIHRQGRGFEGFAKTRTVDSRNQLVHDVLYNQTFPYTGTVDEDNVYQSNGTSVITHGKNTYKVTTVSDLTDTAGAKCLQITPLAIDTRCFPYLDISTVDSRDVTAGSPLLQTTETNYDVDEYGNPTQVTTTTTDKDSTTPSPFVNGVWTSVVTSTITNYTTSPQWCLGKPTRTTTKNTLPDGSNATRTVDHTVDATNCRFNSETIEPTISLLTVVTSFGYDTCGNVNSVSIVGKDKTGAAMPARATTSSFGTRCAFPESVTNALGQTATTAYNYSYGVKSSATDPNGIAVSWGYDTFARRTSEARPDGTSTTWLYEDCITTSCWGVADNLRLRVTETLYSSTYSVVRTGTKTFDALERLRYEAGERVLGVFTNTKVVYDNLGRKVKAYQPYQTADNGYHLFEYDPILGRPTADKLYNASNQLDRTTSMAYSGLKTTLTDAMNNVTQKWADVTGKLRTIIDPSPGGTTQYTFDPFGNLVTMADASTPTPAQTTYTYNIRGFKTASSDPDTGNWTYTPNSLNELMEQRDARNQITYLDYDKLGRMVSRTEPETPATATTWTYGTSAVAHNIGRLQSLSKPGGYAETYTFDSIGRPLTSTYTVDATAYAVDYAYNTLGAVDTVTYPTSSTGYRFTLKYVYSYGFVQQVKDNAAGTIFWSLSSANDYSSPTTEVLGNAATITSVYTPWTNDLTSRQVVKGTTLQNLAYQWDLNGNLSQRQDQLQSLTEVFSYDSLNRLTGGTLNTVSNLSVGYAANGNITSKSDAGSFLYTPQTGCSVYAHLQPHAVRKAGSTLYCYDENGNMTARGGSTISWYSYNQPNQINAGTNSTQFEYNANHQRWKQTAVDGTGTTYTWYIGGIMEKLQRPGNVIEYRHMIPAGSGTAIYMRKPDGTNSTTYLTTDHLGSGDLILDSAGNILARQSFTPFGARRGSNWQGVPTSADYTTFANKTRRGFSGHEMLDAVGLVNMNGRVYDPLIGRFLSADPIIQTIAVSQALNPYSYVMNNPLTLIDPSGYSWLSKLFSGIGKFFKKFWRPILAIVVAYFTYGMVTSYIANQAAVTAAAAGATAAEATAAYVAAAGAWSTAVVAGMTAGAVGGAIVGGIQGAVMGALSGGLMGISSGMWGRVGNLVISNVGKIATNGAIGGWVSEDMGGKFSDGFLFAAGATAALEVYQWATTKYQPTWERGRHLDLKPASGEPATPLEKNVGEHNAVSLEHNWFWKIVPRYEGNWLFEGLNYIPGFNSFATLHDWFMSSISNSALASIVNIPSMGPALAVNYAALMYGPPSIVLAQYKADH